MPSYYIQTLGCPKNEVDSQKIKAYLAQNSYSETKLADADLVIVNTCGFIEPAKAESIETIFLVNKKRKKNSKLIVTGCLAQRYQRELEKEMPEVDLVAPLEADFLKVVHETKVSIKKSKIPKLDLLNYKRLPTFESFSYLKVAEGCDRSCAFCAIPSFRGRQRSRDINSILDEVKNIDSNEIILTAQDILRYGLDKRDFTLKDLLIRLSYLDKWVRLLYLYPASLSDELLDVILKTCVPYFDLSLQHVSSSVLKLMNRAGSKKGFEILIDKIKQASPDAAIRASFIVGFPGETEEDHDELMDFINNAPLDWIGLFLYSDEESTKAYNYQNKVDPEVAKLRYQEAFDLASEKMAKARESLIGKKLLVLCDKVGQGRSFKEAPDIDGAIISEKLKKSNEFYELIIKESLGVDLLA